jgi:hypothetical protein
MLPRRGIRRPSPAEIIDLERLRKVIEDTIEA